MLAEAKAHAVVDWAKDSEDAVAAAQQTQHPQTHHQPIVSTAVEAVVDLDPRCRPYSVDSDPGLTHQEVEVGAALSPSSLPPQQQ